MSSSSTEIRLEDAQAGMELARDLVDHQGTVLLQRGSVLSASMLAALARRGVQRLRVLGDPEPGGPGLDAVRARLEARLAHLFRHQQGAPAGELRARLLAYRLEAL